MMRGKNARNFICKTGYKLKSTQRNEEIKDGEVIHNGALNQKVSDIEWPQEDSKYMLLLTKNIKISKKAFVGRYKVSFNKRHIGQGPGEGSKTSLIFRQIWYYMFLTQVQFTMYQAYFSGLFIHGNPGLIYMTAELLNDQPLSFGPRSFKPIISKISVNFLIDLIYNFSSPNWEENFDKWLQVRSHKPIR